MSDPRQDACGTQVVPVLVTAARVSICASALLSRQCYRQSVWRSTSRSDRGNVRRCACAGSHGTAAEVHRSTQPTVCFPCPLSLPDPVPPSVGRCTVLVACVIPLIAAAPLLIRGRLLSRCRWTTFVWTGRCVRPVEMVPSALCWSHIAQATARHGVGFYPGLLPAFYL